MKLSAPVYHLKRKAKQLSRSEGIPLHAALDRIASGEGFDSWSLLAARLAAEKPAARLLDKLAPGDMVLLGARPGHGKTLLGLELIVEAVKAGRRGAFFTLDYTAPDILGRLRAIGADPAALDRRFTYDTSDAICADYMIEQLADVPAETVVVVDYLQLLDQRRENPALMEQVRALRGFAREKRIVIGFISQVDRAYDLSGKTCPDIADVRLPNPLDLRLFDKACFLNNGEISFTSVN